MRSKCNLCLIRLRCSCTAGLIPWFVTFSYVGTGSSNSVKVESNAIGNEFLFRSVSWTKLEINLCQLQ